MNDPHVERLYYKFRSENTNDIFDKASPLRSTVGSFDIELAKGILSVKPKDHYSDEESVKNAFEPFLHSWESTAYLTPSRFRIRFTYDHADVIDRNPTPGSVTLCVQAAEMVVACGTVTITREMNKYPPPEMNFATSLLTEELIGLIKRYQDGRIPLTAMTNWFETILRREYGSRAEVSRKLGVKPDIISTLGRLSESSDPVHGRKAKGQGPEKLNPAEIGWLEAVVIRLVRRVGEVNAKAGPIPQITLDDFPKI